MSANEELKESMTDHDLLLTIHVNQQHMLGGFETFQKTVTDTSADHEARLRRIERLADRLLFLGAVVAAVGGFLGWLASTFSQWIIPPKH